MHHELVIHDGVVPEDEFVSPAADDVVDDEMQKWHDQENEGLE